MQIFRVGGREGDKRRKGYADREKGGREKREKVGEIER